MHKCLQACVLSGTSEGRPAGDETGRLQILACRGDAMRKVGLSITIRDLLVATAILALMLGHLTQLGRSGPGHHRVTIRVFNRTGGDIDFLRYEWWAVGRLVESSGENSGGVAVAPGGVKAFRVDLPGPVDFSLSCSTSAGRLTSGPVRIDVGGDGPGRLDFDVRPSGIVERGTKGLKKPGPGEKDGW